MDGYNPINSIFNLTANDIFIFNYIKSIMEKDSNLLSHQDLYTFNYIVLNYQFKNILYYLYLKEILDNKYYIEYYNNNQNFSKFYKNLNKYSWLTTFAKKYGFFIAKIDIKKIKNEEKILKSIFDNFPEYFKNNYFIQIIFSCFYSFQLKNNINSVEDIDVNKLDNNYYNIIENNLGEINKILSLNLNNTDLIKKFFDHCLNILNSSFYKFDNILYYHQIRFYLKIAFEFDDTNNTLIKTKITKKFFTEKFDEFIKTYNEYLIISNKTPQEDIEIHNKILSEYLQNNYLLQIILEKKN